MEPFTHKRIVVVGTTSSGKSTLAERLAEKFGCDFVELDALHWEPNWQEAPLEVLRQRVERANQAPAWVVAGNYHIVRDIVWRRAEAIIWLDYPFRIVFSRLWRRTWRRWWYQEELWNGNRESIWTHFKLWSQESLFHWLFKTYWRRKREVPMLLSLPEHKHLKLIRFDHPRNTEEWLNSLR
jgi:adenylate kinase family enzyme